MRKIQISQGLDRKMTHESVGVYAHPFGCAVARQLWLEIVPLGKTTPNNGNNKVKVHRARLLAIGVVADVD